MTEITIGPEAAEGSADALVVGATAGRDLGAQAEWLSEAMPWLDEHLDRSDFEGKPGQKAVVATGGSIPYGLLVVVGLGDDPDAEEVRRAAGTAGRAARRSVTVATTLHRGPGGGAGEVALGFLLAQYTFHRHKSEQKPSLTETLILAGGSDEDLSAARRDEIVAAGVMMARDLVNEPAMEKSPAVMASIAAEMAAEVGLRIDVLDEHQIEEWGLGGLRGVSLGADNPPRLVRMWHEPEDPKAFLAIVGKGIVFDSGGLSIKGASGMENMKTDMSGAAAVFGAMRAIAALDLPVRVLGITPLTENMPGGSALRPGDVLRARNGKTIEVLNTDAEGRLVLADGLSLAVEEGPDLIVDMATLTGACHVALGDHIAGLFGTDEATVAVEAAADAAGERVWRMPLPSDYRKQIDSEIADMRNTGKTRWGGAITAALLLKEFAGDGPWAHLDIAGPARSTDASAYIPKGGTGFGVRTMVALAERMARDGWNPAG